MAVRQRRRAAAVVGTVAALVGGLLASPALATEVAATGDGEPVAAGITVPKVEGMGEDWINGADFSTVLSLEESGVTFTDFDGNDADLFEVLADAGVNWARVRVWNEPFSSADPSQGYGAGSVDAARATEIAERATAAGMRVLVNFHYSDFWAHPGQQKVPRSWQGTTLEERAQALYDYTAETLATMREAGVDVGMVQIGNETTGGEIAGTRGWDSTATLFQAGSRAVRDTLGEDVKVAVHFTNPERSGQYASVARALDEHGVDYDVFLSSYYAFWHGTLENLTAVLDDVATTYDKEVAVVETSWAYTLEDGDGHPNSIDRQYPQYSISPQGQALAVRDVMQAVADVSDGKGLGTFYWEPAWLPVGPPDQAASNWALWEQHGSGWASTHSQEFYDPEGALGDEWADSFGGSAWDNQALFAFDGTPLESLRVYEYARTGAVGPRELDAVESPQLRVPDGSPIELPATLAVSYTDGTTEDQAVTWRDSTGWVAGPGTYTFRGTTEAGHAATATVTVLGDADEGVNHVVNPGFEDGVDPWTGSGSGYTISAPDDPYEGTRSTHFYSANAFSFSIEQQVTGLAPGQYVLSATAQGDGASSSDTLRISAASGISTVHADFRLSGYQAWQTPVTEPLHVGADGVVTVRAELSLSAGAWGTLDAFSLVAVTEQAEADTSALAALVERAEAVERARFTQDSVAALDAALERAGFVLGSARPGQASVDGAAAQLLEALDGLVEAAGPSPTDPPTGLPSDPPTEDGADDPDRTEDGAGESTTDSEQRPGGSEGSLARTGAGLTVAVLAALVLTGGGLLLVAARRRTAGRRQ